MRLNTGANLGQNFNGMDFSLFPKNPLQSKTHRNRTLLSFTKSLSVGYDDGQGSAPPRTAAAVADLGDDRDK